MGGGNPVVIQSMTNTDTADAAATAAQCIELADAGSEIVRITVNTNLAAAAVPKIREILNKKGYAHLPLVGDFHFNGHVLLTEFPECAAVLDKYRVNPGNLGKGEKHDENFAQILKIAKKNKKPIRIGVNWGSLDQELLTALMVQNGKRKNKKNSREVIIEAMVESGMKSAAFAESYGIKRNQIVLSCKMSLLPDMVAAYEALTRRMIKDEKVYALHLGLTEAGSDLQGIVSSSAALGILLNQGIGDTIRTSLTPTESAPRSREVEVCKYILQSLGLRQFRPQITSCPGCGRASNNLFLTLAGRLNKEIDSRMPKWKTQYPGIENFKIAVMGCVVNGPGESKHADIAISLPGKSEIEVAPVYLEGQYLKSLKGPKIIEQFLVILEDFVKRRY